MNERIRHDIDDSEIVISGLMTSVTLSCQDSGAVFQTALRMPAAKILTMSYLRSRCCTILNETHSTNNTSGVCSEVFPAELIPEMGMPTWYGAPLVPWTRLIRDTYNDRETSIYAATCSPPTNY